MPNKKLHGVHAPHRKNTADCVPVRMPIPAVVTIPMSMGIGAPAKPVVKMMDEVKVGQLIAEAGGFVSAPIYSPVSGKVKKLDTILNSMGKNDTVIIIETDGAQTVADTVVPPEITDFDSFINAVRASGDVGMGGAGFPTSVKLKVDPDKVDYVIINGAECEPYITSDTRTMIDDAEFVVKGVKLLKRFYPKAKVVAGVEDNKPKAIEALRKAGEGLDYFEVKALPALYPQGGEKVIVYNCAGRTVMEGKLPIDAGCIVINCTTLDLLAKYVETGMPVVEKVVTVDGSAVEHPQNIIAPIGTSISDILAFTGTKCEPRKVLYGGPMMGISVADLTAPIMKATNAITAFDEKDATPPEITECIKCGRCIHSCPLSLMPAAIETAYNQGNAAQLKALKVNICMECGCCTFACPAKRPLVQVNKLAKVMLNKYNAELKAEAEKQKAKEEAAKAEKEGN